jgi:hypothetical protein
MDPQSAAEMAEWVNAFPPRQADPFKFPRDPKEAYAHPEAPPDEHSSSAGPPGFMDSFINNLFYGLPGEKGAPPGIPGGTKGYAGPPKFSLGPQGRPEMPLQGPGFIPPMRADERAQGKGGGVPPRGHPEMELRRPQDPSEASRNLLQNFQHAADPLKAWLGSVQATEAAAHAAQASSRDPRHVQRSLQQLPGRSEPLRPKGKGVESGPHTPPQSHPEGTKGKGPGYPPERERERPFTTPLHESGEDAEDWLKSMFPLANVSVQHTALEKHEDKERGRRDYEYGWPGQVPNGEYGRRPGGPPYRDDIAGGRDPYAYADERYHEAPRLLQRTAERGRPEPERARDEYSQRDDYNAARHLWNVQMSEAARLEQRKGAAYAAKGMRHPGGPTPDMRQAAMTYIAAMGAMHREQHLREAALSGRYPPSMHPDPRYDPRHAVDWHGDMVGGDWMDYEYDAFGKNGKGAALARQKGGARRGK